MSSQLLGYQRRLTALQVALDFECDARERVCRVAADDLDADLALLVELAPRAPALVVTASAGVPLRGARLVLPATSGLAMCLDRATVVTGEEALDGDLGWQAVLSACAVRTVHLQPVLDGGRPIGVLALGWKRELPGAGSDARFVIALLADGAARAAAHERRPRPSGDAVLTDPVTHLLSSAAFQDALARELARGDREGQPSSLALLDVAPPDDSFARQVDVLNLTATAWRRHQRRSDTFARIAPQRLAVLFPATTLPGADAAVKRLRRALPAGHSSAAALATHQHGEPPERLLSRAGAQLPITTRTDQKG